MHPTSVHCVRVYDPLPESKGWWVLVDRLWPRGIKKESLPLDEWCKDVAPSPELRKWFGHDPQRWEGFCTGYRKELQARRSDVEALLKRCGTRPLLLLYAARDPEYNHARVLKAFIESTFSR